MMVNIYSGQYISMFFPREGENIGSFNELIFLTVVCSSLRKTLLLEATLCRNVNYKTFLPEETLAFDF